MNYHRLPIQIFKNWWRSRSDRYILPSIAIFFHRRYILPSAHPKKKFGIVLQKLTKNSGELGKTTEIVE